MLLVAAYCTGRLVVSFRTHRTTHRDTDAVHAVMGVSMAGMLTPSLTAAPNGLWLLVFSASALWFGWRVLHDANGAAGGTPLSQHLTHLLMCAAMIYMLILMEADGSSGSAHGAGMAGMRMGALGASAPSWSLLAVVLAVLLCGDALIGVGLTLRPVAPRPARPRPEPELEPELALARMEQGSERGGSPLPASLPSADGVQDAPSADGVQDAPPAAVLSPHSAVACQLVMSLVMGYMLVTLL